MARKHDWGYKRVDNSYHTVCKDCASPDRTFKTEQEAINRVAYLKVLGVKPSKLQAHFPKRLF